jgi:NTE family protein
VTKHALKAPHQTVLVLQGGGALGAYQAGAYEALAKAGHEPDWIAGISIGSINAALIAGNPKAKRAKQVRAFWENASDWLSSEPVLDAGPMRAAFTEWAAALVMTRGVPGFFLPRLFHPAFMPKGSGGATSFYDTCGLRDTLNALVDFDYLNSDGPRLSVGAVDVETGNFTYFDSATTEIRAEHIMASGALPPAFGAVEIDGRSYWDGGLVSNTPLQFVLENATSDPMTIFQVDLFSARGALPGNLAEVAAREKDIRFSSRTRLNTDRFHELHTIAAAAKRLKEKLPKALQNDPDLAALCAVGPQGPVTLMHLIHRKEAFEGASKDYEFSHISMKAHWAAGRADVETSLGDPRWTTRTSMADDISIFDFGAAA